MKDWSTIYVGSFLPAVELRRSVLEEHAIPAVVLNQRDSSYHFGTIELKVRLEDVDRASALIADTDS
jgi:hypothetical protein